MIMLTGNLILQPAPRAVHDGMLLEECVVCQAEEGGGWGGYGAGGGGHMSKVSVQMMSAAP